MNKTRAVELSEQIFLAAYPAVNDKVKKGDSSLDFLSCLSGSERLGGRPRVVREFLSCLSGSELEKAIADHGLGFLSCLSGSEQSEGKE